MLKNRGFGAIVALWGLAVVAWWGFIAWVIYNLVTHFAG